MSAAEYYSTAPLDSSSYPHSNYLPGPQSPQPTSSQPYYPSSQAHTASQPPPPYTTYASQQQHKPSVHFPPSPTPQHLTPFNQQRPSISNSSPHSWHGSQSQGPYADYQYSASSSQLQPRPYHPQHQNAAPLQNPHYLSPHMHYSQPNTSTEYLGTGCSSDPEDRRRKRHRHSRRSSGESRDASRRDRRSSTDALIGATGGGLIGDLIMPGLGTLGGAALGWLGGKDFGKKRREREDERADAQRAWEEKYGRRHSYQHQGHTHHTRSPGHSGERDRYYDDRSRRRSADDRDRRDDYDYHHRY